MLIVKYNPDWVNHFERIKEKLSKSLTGIAIKIQHIGSTAVPNLAAKPIIDIDVIYDENSDFEHIKKSLESLGYFYNGNQGVQGREVFKRNGVNDDEILDKIAHHLYVCRYDNEELHRHISFRDYLRKDESARNFYQNLKYEIAKEANDNRKIYANKKEIKASSFIDYILNLSNPKQDK